jgi:hypothetical protein
MFQVAELGAWMVVQKMYQYVLSGETMEDVEHWVIILEGVSHRNHLWRSHQGQPILPTGKL